MVARRIHEASAGNPFYALELAAALLRRGGTVGLSGELPVPETLSALLASHLDGAPADARQALLLATLLAEPDEELVGRAAGEVTGVDAAVAAGLLVREGTRLRLGHPL